MEDGVCRKVVWLELVGVEELVEEITHGEPESSLKVGEEDDPLSTLRLGLEFVSGYPAGHLCRDSTAGL